ncbi:hypothetical protein V498_06182 [Pseudogymnoascus sp. VKM F-4517 (FW-2822)]|nr:hypothetical protein V498_06182 [Pseudogymnoascus sp. VKM F-4517 (FW-2822)]
MPALAKALPITTQDQVWQWIENSMGIVTNLKHTGGPERLTVKVEPPGPGPRDQPLQYAPVVGTNALHGAYGSSYSYMGELDSFHKRQKCYREADETEQETIHRSVQDAQVTTKLISSRRTAVQGHGSFKLTSDIQTRAKNETARQTVSRF